MFLIAGVWALRGMWMNPVDLLMYLISDDMFLRESSKIPLFSFLFPIVSSAGPVLVCIYPISGWMWLMAELMEHILGVMYPIAGVEPVLVRKAALFG
jgi:hypothetical protein